MCIKAKPAPSAVWPARPETPTGYDVNFRADRQNPFQRVGFSQLELTSRSQPGISIQGDLWASYDEANRIASVDGASYTYDNNGNFLTTSVMTNTWDAANRLTAIQRFSDSVAYAKL